jgi:glycosyltransferase involved in cell wall biosynthesis
MDSDALNARTFAGSTTETLTDKKHILILPRWYPNQTDVQLGTFIREQAILLKDEFHVHVVYVQALEKQNLQFDAVSTDENGIDERVIYFKSAKGPLRKVINARRYKRAQEFGYLLEPFKPDICHVHVPYRSAFLAVKLQKTGIPFVVTEHWSGHLTGEYEEKNSADKTLYKQVLQKASGIATVSKLLRDKFKENTGFDSIVIPNYIKKSSLELSGRAHETIELLTVSDMANSVKNVSGLILAFKKALQTNNNLRLNIIGGGPDEEKIKGLVDQLELSKSVKMAGRAEHRKVLDAYHFCDFYICNSNYETFGMTVAEALLAGKPVISTRCGGPEEFLHEKNSLLIEKDNEEQLTAAILKMADTFGQYNSEDIAAEIESKYGKEAIKSQLKSFYLQAIND